MEDQRGASVVLGRAVVVGLGKRVMADSIVGSHGYTVVRTTMLTRAVTMGNGLEKNSNYLNKRQWSYAQILWNYLRLDQPPQKSDIILVFGNVDPRTAEHASSLWLQGYGQWLMFSGYLGNYTRDKWTRPEAEIFRDVAIEMGVPSDRIIVETKATNTGENVLFSYKILSSRNLIPSSIILVQMPFMERRVYATFLRQWPAFQVHSDDTHHTKMKCNVIASSPQIALAQYPNENVGKIVEIVQMMLETMKRIIEYPEKGLQIPQVIPDEVKNAYEKLKNDRRFSSRHREL